MPGELLLVALPLIAAFIASVIVGPSVIGGLKRMKLGQTIQKDGPESHFSKAGTPTMGGVIIVFGMLVGLAVTLLTLGLLTPHNQMNLVSLSYPWMHELIAVLILVMGYAVIGLVDDYLTIRPIKGVRGIASRPKAAIQFLLAVGFVVWLRQTGFEPVIYFAGRSMFLGEAYWVLAVVFITGMANFTNITDGLDGLLSGLASIALVALFITACSMGMFSSATYDGERALVVGILFLAAVGACVAFLWFNKHPAKVFMGDTGSLAIGALLPAAAIVLHKEILMIVIGGVLILDGFSTIIQWAVFKYTRIRTGTGRRVFLKSPVHHHFEMAGWPEQTVVVRFWICGVIAAVIGYAGAVQRWW